MIWKKQKTEYNVLSFWASHEKWGAQKLFN